MHTQKQKRAKNNCKEIEAKEVKEEYVEQEEIKKKEMEHIRLRKFNQRQTLFFPASRFRQYDADRDLKALYIPSVLSSKMVS
jgi:hypothetical protein